MTTKTTGNNNGYDYDCETKAKRDGKVAKEFR
jgi:hypothetical protein